MVVECKGYHDAIISAAPLSAPARGKTNQKPQISGDINVETPIMKTMRGLITHNAASQLMFRHITAQLQSGHKVILGVTNFDF